jgi:hypothetical protein
MIELIGVPVGAKLRLQGSIVAEILECIDDEWVKIRILESGRPGATPGDEELCHATDVIEVIA